MSSDKKSWENLRKEARNLENEIDSKLVSFSKLGANSALTNPTNSGQEDTVPLLSSDRMFETLSQEIESLLKRLSQVNNEMTELTSTNSAMCNAGVTHTLQRHCDILKDYMQEFQKTLNNLKSRREREELLHGAKNENKPSLNRRVDICMKEYDHLKNSERLIDDQINIAIETKEAMVNQRAAFKRIQSRINDITTRFPAINNVIQRIHLKKRKDTIIIGCVIGFCTFLLIIYAFN